MNSSSATMPSDQLDGPPFRCRRAAIVAVLRRRAWTQRGAVRPRERGDRDRRVVVGANNQFCQRYMNNHEDEGMARTIRSLESP